MWIGGMFFQFLAIFEQAVKLFERCLPVAVHTFVGSVDAYLQTAHAIFCSRHARIAVGFFGVLDTCKGLPP